MTIQIRVDLPQIRLTWSAPRVDVDTAYPQVHIEQELPRVRIDQTPPLGEIGLQRSLELARTLSLRARQRAAEAIVAYAREGDMFLDVHKGVTVGRVAKAKAEAELPELNVEALPKSRPRIDVEGGLAVDVRLGGVEVEAERGHVKVDLIRGRVIVATGREARPGTAVDVRI